MLNYNREVLITAMTCCRIASPPQETARTEYQKNAPKSLEWSRGCFIKLDENNGFVCS